MSRLTSVQHSESVERKVDDSSCEACGRIYENPIKLTNLSATPMQIYEACPFCFSKLNEAMVSKEYVNLDASTSKNSGIDFFENQKDVENSKKTDCPQSFGYLKKRPKNTPIPDTCLTCEKMIKCLL